jgi:hypothetical protein
VAAAKMNMQPEHVSASSFSRQSWARLSMSVDGLDGGEDAEMRRDLNQDAVASSALLSSARSPSRTPFQWIRIRPCRPSISMMHSRLSFKGEVTIGRLTEELHESRRDPRLASSWRCSPQPMSSASRTGCWMATSSQSAPPAGGECYSRGPAFQLLTATSEALGDAKDSRQGSAIVNTTAFRAGYPKSDAAKRLIWTPCLNL